MSYRDRAAIYTVEYQESRDLPFVLSLIGDRVRHVIEMPCGAGRLSRHLAPRVERLDVVDLEPDMVARAVDSARRASPSTRVEGHVQDMSELSLPDASGADLAIIPREALQLVPPEDGRRVLAAVAGHLAVGGRLLVDLATFTGVSDPPDPDYFKPRMPFEAWSEDWVRALPDGRVLRRASKQSEVPGAIHFEMKYSLGSDFEQQWSSSMTLYRYSCTWIDESVPTGLRLEHVYGGYDRSSPGPASRRLLALYVKSTS